MRYGVRGHNLLEVVVAAFILSSALILVAGIWSTYYTSANQSRNTLVATNLARTVLEEQSANGYDSLTPILGVPQTTMVTARSQIRGRQLEVPYTIEVYATDTSQPGTRRLAVTLEWPDVRGLKSFRYETFLFRTQ